MVHVINSKPKPIKIKVSYGIHNTAVFILDISNTAFFVTKQFQEDARWSTSNTNGYNQILTIYFYILGSYGHSMRMFSLNSNNLRVAVKVIYKPF